MKIKLSHFILKRGQIMYKDCHINYIEHSLKSLKYPKFFILDARKKLFRYFHDWSRGRPDGSLFNSYTEM